MVGGVFVTIFVTEDVKCGWMLRCINLESVILIILLLMVHSRCINSHASCCCDRIHRLHSYLQILLPLGELISLGLFTL